MTAQTDLPPEDLSSQEQLSDNYEPQWSQWTRQFVTVLLVIAGIYALTFLAPILQILVAAFLMAFLLYIPCRFVARRTNLNFSGAVAVVYLLLILIIFLLLVNVVPGFVESGRGLSNSIQRAYVDVRLRLEEYTPDQGKITVLNIPIDADPLIQQVRQLLGVTTSDTDQENPGEENTNDIADLINPSASFDPGAIINFLSTAISNVVGSITGFFSTMFLALFVSFLILVELPTYQRQFLKNVPRSHRREVIILIDKMRKIWTGFFKGQVTICILIGVLTWLQLTVMGVNSALALAVATAIVSLIPTIGGIIALIPLGLVPFIEGSTTFTEMPHGTFALLVVGVNLVISQVIWSVIAPKILGDAIALPIPVIILGIFIGTAVGGAIGAFLIVPILGTLRVVVIYLLHKINKRDPFPGEDVPEVTFLARL